MSLFGQRSTRPALELLRGTAGTRSRRRIRAFFGDKYSVRDFDIAFAIVLAFASQREDSTPFPSCSLQILSCYGNVRSVRN